MPRGSFCACLDALVGEGDRVALLVDDVVLVVAEARDDLVDRAVLLARASRPGR